MRVSVFTVSPIHSNNLSWEGLCKQWHLRMLQVDSCLRAISPHATFSFVAGPVWLHRLHRPDGPGCKKCKKAGYGKACVVAGQAMGPCRPWDLSRGGAQALQAYQAIIISWGSPKKKVHSYRISLHATKHTISASAFKRLLWMLQTACEVVIDKFTEAWSQSAAFREIYKT